MPGRADAIVSWTVLVDGAAIASAVALTGGYRSPLLFLVFLDVIAVTLVVSYRTGLKLALWCALLLLFAHAAADAGIIHAPPVVAERSAVVSAAPSPPPPPGGAVSWPVTDGALGPGGARLEQRVDLGAERERALRPDDVRAPLARPPCSRLAFTRAVVLVRT